MKKLAILFSISVLFLATGCSIDVKRLDNLSYSEIVDTILNQKITLKNVSFDGYTYYLPKGVQLHRKSQYNSILYDRGNPLYLYVDIISYYHKVDNQAFTANSEAFLSKEIYQNKKKGYIEINEIRGKYFVEFMYNYAKIEAYVSKENLQEMLIDMSTILASIQFHDTILETLVGEHVLDYKEETFNIFKPSRDEDSFLKYIEEYDTRYKEDEEWKNEDSIDIDQGIE